MLPTGPELFVVLLTAHLVGACVARPESAPGGRRGGMRHAGAVMLSALLAYALVGRWSAWPIPAFVAALQALAVALPDRWRASAPTFGLHKLGVVGVLATAAFWMAETGHAIGLDAAPWWPVDSPTLLSACVLVSGLIAALDVGSGFVARLVKPHLSELEEELKRSGQDALRPARGLSRAGNVIGKLERLLVFVFVLAGQPAGIGFLIAAKSVFRFGEIKDAANRMESEYILIGTLASFAHAVVVSYATQHLLKLV